MKEGVGGGGGGRRGDDGGRMSGDLERIFGQKV